jgi:hypothetical protein
MVVPDFPRARIPADRAYQNNSANSARNGDHEISSSTHFSIGNISTPTDHEPARDNAGYHLSSRLETRFAQQVTMLSGGHAQHVKFTKVLSKRDTGRSRVSRAGVILN